MSQSNYKPLPRLTTETIKRFWENVDRRGPDECWHWTGLLLNGYGVMYVGGENFYSIRILHTIMNGVDPGEMVVRHTCDVKSCCNFLHHVLGSHEENMRDAKERNRFGSGARNGSRTHPESRPRGEDQGNAKLTEVDIICIRERYAAGESCGKISEDYPVNSSNIQQIIKGKRWAHIGGPKVDGNLSRIGAHAPSTKLTSDEVIEILKKRSEGHTINSLRQEYSVTQGAINAIIYGKSWQHLGAPLPKYKKQFTAETVREIRVKFAAGQSAASLAREYGTSHSNIHNIINRITWSEVG